MTTITTRFPGQCILCGRCIPQGTQADYMPDDCSLAHLACIAQAKVQAEQERADVALYGELWLTSLEEQGLTDWPSCTICSQPVTGRVTEVAGVITHHPLTVVVRATAVSTEYCHESCVERAKLNAGQTVRRRFVDHGYEPGEAFYDHELSTVLVSTSCVFRPADEEMDELEDRYVITARGATAAEAAPVLAAEADRQARAEAKARVCVIACAIQAAGERPEGSHRPEGQTLLDTSDIYGGGNWFVVGPTYLWYVANNGTDGAMWSANNVATGGAGAIGWRVPINAVLAEELRQLASVLT